MVVVHAPVFLPSSSIVFAASGIDAVDVAARVPEHQDLPRPRGFARRGGGKRRHHLRHVLGARRLSDSRQIAAAAARGSAGAAGLRRRRPAPGAGAGSPNAVFRAGPSASVVTDPLFAVSVASYHCANAPFISARVDRAVLVGVKRRPQRGVSRVTDGTGRASGLRGLRRLGLTKSRGQQDRR